MKYITKLHALNLKCNLNTSGDWHWGDIQWESPVMKDTNNSFFGDYGIEYNKKIPYHKETFTAANHIRALLDMLEENDFNLAEGMRNEYIDNEELTKEVFHKVYSMHVLANWNGIYNFMLNEYKLDWYFFVKEKMKREQRMGTK
ncbi:hypothetical protein [Oceanobacillus timonensis]|uniref:hypothetical protein n=1 Tax=Oceanobacillus timonensis TaxID=1926285 RepID=UPI0009BBFF38|nr:hypothetical protein [Oceanobacillus timonensis]